MAPFFDSVDMMKSKRKVGTPVVDAAVRDGATRPKESTIDLGGNDPNNMSPTSEDVLEPIAVVGISLKFPAEATSEERFWKMMLEKRCASKEYPSDRMNINAFYHPNPQKLDRVSVQPLLTIFTKQSQQSTDLYQRSTSPRRGCSCFRCIILRHSTF